MNLIVLHFPRPSTPMSSCCIPFSFAICKLHRHEHLRAVQDEAFVHATAAFRASTTAPRFACPICLEAFPLHALLTSHRRVVACARRAPALALLSPEPFVSAVMVEEEERAQGVSVEHVHDIVGASMKGDSSTSASVLACALSFWNPYEFEL